MDITVLATRLCSSAYHSTTPLARPTNQPKGEAITFFTRKDSKAAKELQGIMKQAEQFVPPELEAMAAKCRPGGWGKGGGRGGKGSFRGGKGGGFRGGKGGGGGFRGGKGRW